jgi:hypothetical protein
MRCARLAAGLLLSTSVLLGAAPLPARAADDSIVVKDCRYGAVYQFTRSACTASIENRTKAPLTLTVTPVQPDTSVEPAKLTVAPLGRAEVSLGATNDDVAGALTWTYRIDGAGDGAHFVHASGFVSSVLDAARPTVDFGNIEPSGLPTLRSIALGSSIDPGVRVTRVLASPPMLHALIGSDGKSLTLELRPDAPWGAFDEIVKLALDHPQQKQAWVHVTGRVKGPIGPPGEPYWLGEIVRQPATVLTIPLIDQDGHAFSIGAVTSRDFAATYSSAPCEPDRDGCLQILARVADSQPAGFFKSTLDVELPDRHKHVLVPIWGVLGELPKPGEAPVVPTMQKLPVPASTGDVGITAIPPTRVQPDPPGSGPLLKWTAGQQDAVYGYQVLRGDSPEGPFVLMQPSVIPKIDNGRGSVSYRWRDTSANKGQAYWYYIAVLYVSGDRKPLSTPRKTIAD